MKVKELIEELKKMPEDAVIGIYSEYGETDGVVNTIKLTKRKDYYAFDGEDNEPPYYCNADSQMFYYLMDNPAIKNIVVLGDTSEYWGL